MTEAEWLACVDPSPMLAFLSSRLTERKLALLAAACCRRIWHLFSDDRSRRAVEAVEQRADESEKTTEALSARRDAFEAYQMGGDASPSVWEGDGVRNTAFTRFIATYASHAAFYATEDWSMPGTQTLWIIERVLASAARAETVAATWNIATAIASGNRSGREAPGEHVWRIAWEEAWNNSPEVHINAARQYAWRKAWEVVRDTVFTDVRAAQAALLRDLFGDCFHSPIISTNWMSWHDGLVGTMSRRMYEERNFADIRILADALEEAGCENADILNHCRSGGEHVRGCWVIDLLLGKP